MPTTSQLREAILATHDEVQAGNVKLAKVEAFYLLEELKEHTRDVVERFLREVVELEVNPLLGEPLMGAYEVVIDGARLKIKLRSLRIGDYRVITDMIFKRYGLVNPCLPP